MPGWLLSLVIVLVAVAVFGIGLFLPTLVAGFLYWLWPLLVASSAACFSTNQWALALTMTLATGLCYFVHQLLDAVGQNLRKRQSSDAESYGAHNLGELEELDSGGLRPSVGIGAETRAGRLTTFRLRLLVIALAAVLTATVAVFLISVMRNSDARYSAAEVRAAFREEAVPVRIVELPELPGVSIRTPGSVLAPPDGRFTVLVLDSASTASNVFRQFAADATPSTFEMHEANVIVLADGSNSREPLPQSVRSKIRAALDSLRGSHAS